MAKYEVTHTCGHEVTVDMIGRNREWRLERMAEYPCVSCRREERAAMNAERVLALLGSNTLPTLEAVSDKQREYAERVRDQWIAVQRIPAIGRLAVYLTTAKQWLDYDGDQRTKLIATKALEAPEGANDLARAAWEFVRELHRAIAAQSQQPFNKTHYEATIARLAQIECATLAARAITQTQAGGR